MVLTNLDLDALRTLTLTQEMGSYGDVAAHLGRTPSAISLQMKRLQESVGAVLFRRSGRTVVLTEQGEIALQYARRVLALNDEMLDTLRGASQSGSLSIGFSEDFAVTMLPRILARYSMLYPMVRLEVFIGRSTSLQERISAGKMDIALIILETVKKAENKIADVPLHWVAGSDYADSPSTTLNLALFEPPCIFRSRAVEALESVHRPWRIALTSPSIAGLWAAVSAGFCVTARAHFDIPTNLKIVDNHLPSLGEVCIVLQRRKHLRAAHALRLLEITEEAVRAALKVAY